MLKLEIGHEVFNETTLFFGFEVEYVLELEHSLATLSKWESIWEKPFIDDQPKTEEEMKSYIECMIVGDVPEDFWPKLSQKNWEEINSYINRKMTATWFNENGPKSPKKSNEKITSELVYWWLSGIQSPPPGYEHWHLNNLFTYIRIHDVKNRKPTKRNPTQVAAERRELIAKRRAETGSRG